jgi:leucoanthocyanidin reductase
VDRARPVGAGLGFYEDKRRVRRAAEASGVPYTYICCNSIAGWPYFDNKHPSEVPPPLDRFQIYGDGTVRGHTRFSCHLRTMIPFLVDVLGTMLMLRL